MTPAITAKTLAAFADILLPGDDVFPSATVSGALGLFAGRVRGQRGPDALRELSELLDGHGGPFLDAGAEARIATVAALESTSPALFGFLRQTLYLSYYEMPSVITALQELGHDYNATPQPSGYAMDPFDPKADLPAERRGGYKATDDIVPIDLSALSDLNLPVVQQ